jgi:hypothetical protein
MEICIDIFLTALYRDIPTTSIPQKKRGGSTFHLQLHIFNTHITINALLKADLVIYIFRLLNSSPLVYSKATSKKQKRNTRDTCI